MRWPDRICVWTLSYTLTGDIALLDRIFAQDRAANPGKYPLAPGEYDVVPRTVGEYTRTATKDDTLAMRVHTAAVKAVNGEVDFHVVARKGDVVILVDEADALWAAKKL